MVELRNCEWWRTRHSICCAPAGLGYCCVDKPRLRGLMPPLAVATSEVGYVRFHVRNAAKWWQHEESWERYDYLYTEDERQEWAPRIHALGGRDARDVRLLQQTLPGQGGSECQHAEPVAADLPEGTV